MSQYADRIADLSLFTELRASAGRCNVSESEVQQLAGMVLGAAERAGPLLKRIPLTFRQYTEHDVEHSRNVAALMGRFIPHATLRELNAVELAILLLAALLHDLGMYVTDQEKAQVLASEEYGLFAASHSDRVAAMHGALCVGNAPRAEAIRDALLAEYFRRIHPQRARRVVEAVFAGSPFHYREADLTDVVMRICESHGWGVMESNDPAHPDHCVVRLDVRRPVYGVPVNEQYLACCLRLADVMDFDRSRTPLAVFQHLDFTEHRSWTEWSKHLQVRGWTISEYEVEYYAECTHPAFYVAVMEFLDAIDTELRQCRELIVRNAPRRVPEWYQLHLPPVVDRRVAMADPSYIAGAFRFQLEYDRIMQLLMDKSLYADPALFLRELLQNAVDACRMREALAREAGEAYEPRVDVWNFSRDEENPRIVFQDNGIGMSRRIVESYFMRVGRSFYRSAEFDGTRQRLAGRGIHLEATSQFGIGVLSCFMVADRFEVETHRADQIDPPLHITIEGPGKYFLIRRLDAPARVAAPEPPRSHGPLGDSGTRVTVFLRDRSPVDVLQVLERFAVNAEVEVRCRQSEHEPPSVLPASRWTHARVSLSSMPEALLGLSRSSLEDEAADLSDDHDGEVERWRASTVLQSLDRVLQPVEISFRDYPFAEHLHGRAWLWLLAGTDGHPAPRTGYLKISDQVRCTGAPAFVAELIRHVMVKSNKRDRDLVDVRGAFRWILQRAVNEGTNPFAQTDAPTGATGKLGYPSASLSRAWQALDGRERSAALRWMAGVNERTTPWYEVPGLPATLAAGEDGWADTLADFGPAMRFAQEPQRLALYGILIPSGILRWDPRKLAGRGVPLMNTPGGQLLDARGFPGPVPAVNRLSVDWVEGQKIGIPFLRALLAFSAQLYQQGIRRDVWGWRDWFGLLLTSVERTEYGREALALEGPGFLPSLTYAWGDWPDARLLSRAELVDGVGPWVRPVQEFQSGHGLQMRDKLTRFLTRGCEWRTSSGGPREIYLAQEQPAAPPPQAPGYHRPRG
jgi:hypothetical protein